MTIRAFVLLTPFLVAATFGVYCFAASPSATLSVTVTPSGGGGGGGACAFGPNYNGSIPAPAAVAGFNTCAANYDWTNGSNFTTNGHTYNFSDISSWLDCAGAANPLWWVVSFIAGPHAPCSDFNMANDGGVNVIQMTLTPSDHANGIKDTTMQTTQQGSGNGTAALPTGFAFPEEFYVEFKIRFVSADTNKNGGGVIADWWSVSATPNSPYMEYDFMEFGPFSNDGTGSNQDLTFFPEAHPVNPNNVSGYNHNNYNVFGERVTMDTSGNAAICFYVNGAQTVVTPQSGWTQSGNCAVGQWPATWHMNELLAMLINMGPVDVSNPAMAGPLTANTQYFRLFTCAAGVPPANAAAGFACAGSPITSNP